MVVERCVDVDDDDDGDAACSELEAESSFRVIAAICVSFPVFSLSFLSVSSLMLWLIRKSL